MIEVHWIALTILQVLATFGGAIAGGHVGYWLARVTRR